MRSEKIFMVTLTHLCVSFELLQPNNIRNIKRLKLAAEERWSGFDCACQAKLSRDQSFHDWALCWRVSVRRFFRVVTFHPVYLLSGLMKL